MAVTPDTVKVRVELIDAIPNPIREETWRRATVTSGKTVVQDANINVFPGELVLVSTELIHQLLALCGFARVDEECGTEETL